MRNNWLMTSAALTDGEETTKAHGGMKIMVNRFIGQYLDNNNHQKICQLSLN